MRQHDAGERTALAELRDGSVGAAIDWYAASGRIHTRPDRIETLAAMTTAWPGQHPEPIRAVSEPPAVARPKPPSLRPSQRLRSLTNDYHDLHAGTGRWAQTPQGAAARARDQARSQLHDAQRHSLDPSLPRRERRNAAKSLDSLTATLQQAEQRWQELGEPIADRLRDQITTTRHEADRQRVTETRERLDRHLTSRLPAPTLDRDLGIGL